MLKNIFLLMLFLLSVSYANNIEVDENTTVVDAASIVRVYQDKSGKLEFGDILKMNPDVGTKYNSEDLLGFKSGVYWFRVDIKNRSSKELNWIFSIPRINGAGTLYVVGDNQEIESANISDLYVFLNHPTIAYSVLSQPNETCSLLLRLSFDDGGFVYPEFDIMGAQFFHEKCLKQTMAKSFTLGAVFVLFFYNLFLFFSLKSKAYGWYCVYMLGVLVFVLGNSGVGYQYIWGGVGIVSKNIFTTTYPLMFAAALQFSRVFLRTKENIPFVDKILNLFSMMFLSLLLFAIFGFRVNAAKIFSISSLIMSILPFVGFYAWRRGYKEARFYTFAWGVWAIGMIPLMLLMLGFDIKHETVTIGARIGLICEALLLSFAMADQINILQKERDEAIVKYDSQRVRLEVNSRLMQMGEMMAAVAHQWRQPLNLTALHVQEIVYIFSENRAKSTKEIFGELNKIKELVAYMTTTLNDFKDFFSPSKLKNSFSVVNSIRKTLDMVGKQYEHEEIQINIEGSDELSYFGKENEIRQVVLNILNNAKDAFINNNIVTRVVNIAVYREGQSVVTKISDNAGGIPEALLPNIFDQYFTTKGEDGTGIGLYICKRIIEDGFGGEIKVENNSNGAVFTISIPEGV